MAAGDGRRAAVAGACGRRGPARRRAAGTAFAGDDDDDWHRQPGHLDEIVGNGFRLPAFLAGIASIPAMFALGRNVDDDRLGQRRFDRLQRVLEQQHAVASDPADVPVDGAGCDLQIKGNLSAGHAADDFHEDLLVQVGYFLPAG